MIHHCAFCDTYVPPPGAVTFDEFMAEFDLTWHSLESSEWRRGQCVMNVLSRTHPELYEQLSQSDLDPFFIDARIDTCLKWLKEHMQ